MGFILWVQLFVKFTVSGGVPVIGCAVKAAISGSGSTVGIWVGSSVGVGVGSPVCVGIGVVGTGVGPLVSVGVGTGVVGAGVGSPVGVGVGIAEPTVTWPG